MATRPVTTGASTHAPSNIVRLPTAARRKVNNYRFVAQSWAARAAREATAWPGVYIDPLDRRMDKLAAQLIAIEETPIARLVQAILGTLDDTARSRVIEVLAPGVACGVPAAEQALALFQTTKMTVGDQHYLGRAMDRARGRH